MNLNKLMCALVLVVAALGGTSLEARRRHHCCGSAGAGATMGFFAGAFTGAAIANNRSYYVDMPTYDVYYPGAPILAYDYPAYVYAPMYAYPDTLYTYPGYYFAY